jgi:hypothetical protein
MSSVPKGFAIPGPQFAERCIGLEPAEIGPHWMPLIGSRSEAVT